MNIEQWQRDQLGDNLSYYIDKSGHTQGWVAYEAGVARATLQSWCGGVRVANAIQLKAVANVLGVTVDMLLAGVTTIPCNTDGTSPLE